jgi:LysR family glycine cleavage system transcriptional activator
LAEHGGLEEVALAQLGAMHFDQSLLSIDAAKREQGVVLTSPMLVEDEVEAGLLIEPFTQRLTLDRGYYLVHPRSAQLSPAVQQVKQWLIAQTGP